MSSRAGIRLRLPATSANLGPGFDAAGLALSLHLTVEAWPADHDAVTATGRDAAACGRTDGHLVLTSYRAALGQAGVSGPCLSLRLQNEIPLGMGCGSSAAARLAGVALANAFGDLGWSDEQVVTSATGLEGHPDNVAACWCGGFTVSVPVRGGVRWATLPQDGAWQFLLALPEAGLATEKARDVLPAEYSREDSVFNVQRTALLTAAFAQGRRDLLGVAMADRMHQPYRQKVCGQLVHLDALAQAEEFAGVALSGAGPALLLVLSDGATLEAAEEAARRHLGTGVELLAVRAAGPATVETLREAST